MKELTLDGFERLTLWQILPSDVGSLEESLKVRTLRDRVLSEEFKDEIGWTEQMGQVSFDTDKLSSLESEEFKFSDKEEELIAYGFLLDEQSGEVSTDDSYVSLLEEFYDKVEDIKDNKKS